MAEKMRAAVAEWRDANARAGAAEQQVSTAYLAYFSGLGLEPTREMQDEAKALRKVADALLKTAMELGR